MLSHISDVRIFIKYGHHYKVNSCLSAEYYTAWMLENRHMRTISLLIPTVKLFLPMRHQLGITQEVTFTSHSRQREQVSERDRNPTCKLRNCNYYTTSIQVILEWTKRTYQAFFYFSIAEKRQSFLRIYWKSAFQYTLNYVCHSIR